MTDILTLVRANIRHKKCSFKSIMILMMIISLSVTAIVSLKRNFITSFESAYDHSGAGDVTLNIRNEFLTDELVEKIRSQSYVKNVVVSDALNPDRIDFSSCESLQGGWRIVPFTGAADRMWNEDFTGYVDTPTPKHGEMYISRGVTANRDLSIGDTVTFHFCGLEYSFVLKGFVEEPVSGSGFMGSKFPIICQQDFDEIYAEIGKKAETDHDAQLCLYKVMHIYKTDDCGLTDSRFSVQLNKDTSIGSFAGGELTKFYSVKYHNTFPNVILNVFLAFVIILSVIVFVVMSNGISTGIEMNYTDLGILKAQGYSNTRLKCVFLVQYMFAEVIGTAAGVLLSLPIIIFLPRVFEPMVGLKINGGIYLTLSAAILLGILLLSAGFILLVSRKIGRVSPIRAISGGRSEIYFDSRLNAPVSGKMLAPSLAFRQFTSGKRRYAASIAIASLLMFFLLTTTGMTDAATSENAQAAMGATSENINVYPDLVDLNEENKAKAWEIAEKTEQVIKKYTDIEERYLLDNAFMIFDGEKIRGFISYTEEGFCITKGRVPKYKNEVAVSQIYAEDMGYKIGDKVTVEYRGVSGEFVITGYTAGLSDVGRFFNMSGAAARTLNEYFYPYQQGYKLKDPDKAEQICDELKELFPENVDVEHYTMGENSGENLILTAAAAIKGIIYAITSLFAFIVVTMVCTKTFIREKTDIGIFKAMGFTSNSLRLQFAVRFLIVAVLGISIGTAASFCFSEKLATLMLRSMGIANFVIEYRFMTVALPILAVALSYFLFAFITASRTKRIEVRTLITE